jgi:LPS-assembly protein
MRFRLLVTLLSVLAAVFFGGPGNACAQDVEITIDGTPPWVIRAAKITTQQDKGLYLAEGPVIMTRNDERIQGDYVRYHAPTKTAEIRGNVTMEAEDFKLACTRLVVNVEHNVGKIYEGTVFFPANHYYVSGDEIERTGPDTFTLVQGRATSCDGPSPAWSLTGRNITIRREGYATVEGARFDTKHFPLAYFPWMMLPVKSERQTGLLMPVLRNSSRDGFTYTQPFFWAISDSKDLTVYLTYMTQRGLDTTLEGRYNDWNGKGLYRISYLQDDQAPNIYYERPDRTVTQDERYWVRGMSDHLTDSGFTVKLDVDTASDPEYLQEFEGSFTGFNNTNRQFLGEFGRELAEARDPLRRSTFQATKTINQQNLRFSLEYTQNLNDPDNMETIQRLPRIGLDQNRQAVSGTPFFFSSSTEYTYFARKTDEQSLLNEEGHRLDIHPRFYWPLRLSRFLDLEPSIGLRETIYYPNGMNPLPGRTGDDRDYRFYSRELFDFQIEASSNLSKVYDIQIGPVDRIKHRIKPEVTFTLVPKVSQSDLPYWDSVDRIEQQQVIRYGLVNYLIARMPGGSEYPQSGKAENNGPEYREFLRFGIYREYDFVEAGRELEERSPNTPEDFRRPHSPWELELELDFKPFVWAQARSSYDTYAEMFVDHAVDLQLKDKRGDYLSLSYELHLEPYRLTGRENAEYEEIRGGASVKIDDEWSVQLYKRYSLRDELDLETVYTVSYQPQCWGVRLSYVDKPDDRSVAIYFSLLGLGEVAGYSHQTDSPEPVADTETTTSP